MIKSGTPEEVNSTIYHRAFALGCKTALAHLQRQSVQQVVAREDGDDFERGFADGYRAAVVRHRHVEVVA